MTAWWLKTGGGAALLMALSACATGGLGQLSSADQGRVHRVEATLNDPQIVRGAFLQRGPEAFSGRGRFVYRPGYLLLDYTVPRGMRAEVLGTHLVINGPMPGAVTRVGLGRNPLGLLLRQPMRLTRAIKVTQISETPSLMRISLAEADNPSQGLLSLDFAKRDVGLQLIDLIGLDARNQKVEIDLQTDMGPNY